MEEFNINLGEYEQITKEEANSLNNNEYISITDEEYAHYYFKKKDKFPKIFGNFKEDNVEIKVNEEGSINIRCKDQRKWFTDSLTLPILKEAIKFSDEVQEKDSQSGSSGK